jgi:hypothetical protein
MKKNAPRMLVRHRAFVARVGDAELLSGLGKMRDAGSGSIAEKVATLLARAKNGLDLHE